MSSEYDSSEEEYNSSEGKYNEVEEEDDDDDDDEEEDDNYEEEYEDDDDEESKDQSIDNLIKKACTSGNKEFLQKYIFSEEGKAFDINKEFTSNQNGEINSLLHLACQNRRLGIVKLLCSHTQIDLNKQNSEGNTPFFCACEAALGLSKDKGIIKFLSNNPLVDINQLSGSGFSPLGFACHFRDRKTVKTLVSQKRIVLNKRHVDNSTALHMLCFNGEFKIFKLLCESENGKEIDFNARDGSGETPFFLACEYGHLEIVKYIHNNYKIDINNNQIHKNNYGYSPLYISSTNGQLKIIEYLCENITDIDYNIRTDRGETPFHAACEFGYLDIVKYLYFKFKIDVNHENQITSSGYSPLYVACKEGEYGIVQFLCENTNVYVQ